MSSFGWAMSRGIAVGMVRKGGEGEDVNRNIPGRSAFRQQPVFPGPA
jgi:hypothetical protein